MTKMTVTAEDFALRESFSTALLQTKLLPCSLIPRLPTSQETCTRVAGAWGVGENHLRISMYLALYLCVCPSIDILMYDLSISLCMIDRVNPDINSII